MVDSAEVDDILDERAKVVAVGSYFAIALQSLSDQRIFLLFYQRKFGMDKRNFRDSHRCKHKRTIRSSSAFSCRCEP